MRYVFQIIETEEQPVLSVQLVTTIEEMPQMIGDIYRSVVNYLIGKGQEPVGPAFVAYYNMDMQNLQIEVGFPVQKELEGQGEIVLRHIPAGKKATGFHKGSYREISKVYDALAAFLKEKGYESTGVAYEYYYNSPEEVPESELLTKVEFLLQ